MTFASPTGDADTKVAATSAIVMDLMALHFTIIVVTTYCRLDADAVQQFIRDYR